MEKVKYSDFDFRDIAFDYIQRKASNGCQEAIEIMEYLEK